MAKTMRCRDVGLDCDFVARAETDEEIMKQAVEHARREHQMNEISPDLAKKVRAAIRSE